MILLIEDDPLLRRATGRALRVAGYSVVAAGSVWEARNALAASQQIDAVVSDYDLGDGTAEDIEAYVGALRERCILYSANPSANVAGWPKFLKPNIHSVVAMLKEWKL